MTPLSPSALTAAARLVLRDFKLRRKTMGILLAFVVGLFFLLAVPFADWVEQRPLLFIASWTVLIFLLLGTIGLALYDLLVLRAAESEARRALKNRIFQEPGQPTDYK